MQVTRPHFGNQISPEQQERRQANRQMIESRLEGQLETALKLLSDGPTPPHTNQEERSTRMRYINTVLGNYLAVTQPGQNLNLLT